MVSFSMVVSFYFKGGLFRFREIFVFWFFSKDNPQILMKMNLIQGQM